MIKFVPVLVLIAVSLACGMLSGEEPTPYPTYTPYPTFTPEPAEEAPAEVFLFAATKSTLSETGDIDGACVAALGPGWRTADWNDIVEFIEAPHAITDFVAKLGDFTQLWVTYNANGWYSEQRHYFIEVHEGELPEGWLSHADIDEHFLDLGSWYDLELSVLCYQSDEPPTILESEADAEEAESEESAVEAPQTPESPPTFQLRFVGTQPCGEWPHYAVFEAESTSIWILQSAHFEVFDNTNNQSVYNGSNDRPFLKEGECPPGDTILPPFNTRYLAVNIKEPAAGTSFSAAITLCTEEATEGECVNETVDFDFDADEAIDAAQADDVPEGEAALDFVGVWENPATGAVLEFSADLFVNTFWFQNGDRVIYYDILAYDVEEGHLDLSTDRVLQAGEEVEYDWDKEQFLSYTISGEEMKMFIGPNPYPNAAAGVTYIRQDDTPSEEEAQAEDPAAEPEGEPAFNLEFAGTHPCGNNPTYGAFWVENISQHTFESVSLIINDVTNDKHMYGGSNDRGFVAEGGCPPGESNLSPGARMQVAAIMRNPDAAAEFEATIKLCTQDGVEGECVTQKVTFSLE